MQARPLITPIHDVDKPFDDEELAAYQEVLESMEQGIIVWSDEGVCTLVNQRYYEVTGASKAHLYSGYAWDDYMNRLISLGQYTKEQVDDINAKMASREIFNLERASGNGTFIALTVRPLRSGGHVVSVTDVTKSKRQEKNVALALERAEQAEVEAQNALSIQQTRQTEVDKLSEFGDWLHSCKSLTELYEIVNQAMQNIYPHSSGQLYIYSNSRDILDGVCSWGDSGITENIQAQDCWSLRRGRVFEFGNGMIQFNCNHVHNTETCKSTSYCCLPLVAHGDTVGLLHIDFTHHAESKKDTQLKTFNLSFVTRCAEQISLAVANAQLRDELHEQSTRDSLTSLFNRRYFLERCRSEATRATHLSEKFGLAMFDADNFKTFNDHYGHDAGDAVLCHIADTAHKHFADDEVVARIGGEEFAVLSTNVCTEKFIQRLEEFKVLVASMNIRHYNKPLPAVTVSIGYVVFPDHGTSIPELIKIADSAMYRAKESGKNCVFEGEKLPK